MILINCGNWKTFIDLGLQHYGGDVLLRGNFNKKNISSLTKISRPLVKEILEIWSESFFEAKVSSEDHLLSLPFFQNKHNLKIRPLDYFGIVSAIKRLQRKGVQHKYVCIRVKKNGTMKLTAHKMKRLIGVQLTSWPFNVRRTRNS